MLGKMFINVMNSYGWKINNNGIYGSVADIYVENDTYYMIIDDGNCVGRNHIFHIYNINSDGKIFEGRLNNSSDFEILMRFLGFEKKEEVKNES